MTIYVRYFAVLRDRAGVSEETVQVESLTARELADHLIAARNLGLPSPLIRVAVNDRFVEDGVPLSDGDRVVLLPPVAGG